MIVIVPYQPGWPDEFARLAAPIRQTLGPLALRIDHIGSTAVHNLAAKNVIDIQLTVAALTSEVEAALESLGCQRSPDITADHVPPRFEGPAAEWEKWFFRAPAHLRPMNLHVRIHNRANQRYALLFRDYLRAHSTAAEAYGLIKQQLARRHPEDLDAYYDIKDPVCDLIWHAADQWAQTTGWQPDQD